MHEILRRQGTQERCRDALNWSLITGRAFRFPLIELGDFSTPHPALEFVYPECSVFWIPTTSIEKIEQTYLGVAQQLHVPGLGGREDFKKLRGKYGKGNQNNPSLNIYWVPPEYFPLPHEPAQRMRSLGEFLYSGCSLATIRGLSSENYTAEQDQINSDVLLILDCCYAGTLTFRNNSELMNTKSTEDSLSRPFNLRAERYNSLLRNAIKDMELEVDRFYADVLASYAKAYDDVSRNMCPAELSTALCSLTYNQRVTHHILTDGCELPNLQKMWELPEWKYDSIKRDQLGDCMIFRNENYWMNSTLGPMEATLGYLRHTLFTTHAIFDLFPPVHVFGRRLRNFWLSNTNQNRNLRWTGGLGSKSKLSLALLSLLSPTSCAAASSPLQFHGVVVQVASCARVGKTQSLPSLIYSASGLMKPPLFERLWLLDEVCGGYHNAAVVMSSLGFSIAALALFKMSSPTRPRATIVAVGTLMGGGLGIGLGLRVWNILMEVLPSMVLAALVINAIVEWGKGQPRVS